MTTRRMILYDDHSPPVSQIFHLTSSSGGRWWHPSAENLSADVSVARTRMKSPSRWLQNLPDLFQRSVWRHLFYSSVWRSLQISPRSKSAVKNISHPHATNNLMPSSKRVIASICLCLYNTTVLGMVVWMLLILPKGSSFDSRYRRLNLWLRLQSPSPHANSLR